MQWCLKTKHVYHFFLFFVFAGKDQVVLQKPRISLLWHYIAPP